MLYWFTVDPEHPDVLDVGIRNGLWGVPEDERDIIEPLEPGDCILFFQRDHGFVMCEVESEPYTESVPVWTDVDYPHRVRISAPVETDRYAHLGEVHECLLDPETGEPFSSMSNAATALEGAGGRFRPLEDEEIRCLFRRLGWTLPPDVSPAPEVEPEEPAEETAEPAAEVEDEPPEEEEEAAAEETPGDAEEEPDEDEPEEEPAEAEDDREEPEDEEPPQAEPPPVEEVPGPAKAEPAVAEPVAESEDDDEPSAAPDAETVEAEPVGAPAESKGVEAESEGVEAAADAASAPRVLLVPATRDTESRRRFGEMVADGIDAGRLEDHLADDDREALRAAGVGDRVRVWAAAETEAGPAVAWGDVGRGDVVLFAGGGRVFASARVLATLHHPELADELWGGDDGEASARLLFVSEPVAQDVAYGELDEAAGLDAGSDVGPAELLDAEIGLRVLGTFPELGLTAPPERGEASERRPGAEEGGVDDGPGKLSVETGVGLEKGEETGVGAMDEARLRVLLFGRRQLGRCALCGRLLPVDLLAVVYVKPLAACAPEELKDVGNNVFPACRLGCAGLFRQGFVVVEDGHVEPGRSEPLTDPVAERVEALAGNRCEYWHSGSEPYFRWHAEENRGE